MSKWACGVVFAVTALGCGGASLILKSPLEDRCTEAGLRGCPALAEGITSYVDGNKAEAQQQIVQAAAANSPAQVQEFAEKVRALRELPGASDYVGPLVEVADMLAHAAPKEPVAASDSGRRTAAPSERAAPSNAPRARWEYLVETLPREDASERLGTLGKKGWELVAATPETEGILCVLKRQAAN